MKLINVIIFNGLSVLIRMLTLIGVNKILAIYGGASAFAYISQLQNIVNLSLVLPTNSVNSACIKYTAENKKASYELWRNCTFIVLIASIIVSIILVVFSRQISLLTFGTEEYHKYFLYLAVTLHFMAFNIHLQSILNGLGKLKEYVISSIISNILSAGISIFLIIIYGLKGALISIVISQAFGVIATYLIGRRVGTFSFRTLFGTIQFAQLKKILMFSSMAMFAGAILPLSLSAMRQMIINFCDVESASYWDAVWKISTIYITLISTTLSVYYLPKLSSLDQKKELVREISSGLLFVFFISLSSAFCIYLLQDWLIIFLFSKEFAPMAPLIKYQLIGDVFKMLSWVLGYFLISKACIRFYIISELIQWALFIALGYFFLKKYGVIGAVYSYVYTQIFCLLVLFYYVLKYFKKKGKERENNESIS